MVDDKELVDRIRRFQSLSISFIHSNNDAIKRKISAPIRERAKQAAGEKCPLCPNTMISSKTKKTPLDARESTPDHLIDLCIGGNNTDENILILCHQCNWAKNVAMQQQLKVATGATPGHKGWKQVFRRNPSNIAKLLEYIEWSFRIEEPSSEYRFPVLHGYFMERRFGKSWDPKSITDKTPVLMSENTTISEFERRLEKLENTMWKRFTRFISRPFSRKQKNAPKKTTEESKTRRSKPINSVEKFDLDTWIDENWQGEQSYNQLRDEILAHEEERNGERPLKDILKEDFDIPKSWTIAKKSSHWNESKNPPTELSKLPKQDFTPEEFAESLLRQKSRVQPVSFSTLYGRLTNEDQIFNLKQYGIRPNDYLIEQCSDLLKIIEKPDGKTPPTIHYWITERNPLEGFPESSVSRGIKGFSTANKSLSFPRDPVHLTILVRLFARPNPDSLSYRDLLGISRSEFGKTTPNGADVRIWSYLQHLRGQGPEEVVHESYSNSSPEEIITELHQYFVEVLYLEIHPDDRDIELVDDYFQSIGSEYYGLKKASKTSMLEISKTLHERNTQRSKADKTNTNTIETTTEEDFRKIIIGIVHQSPHSEITISSLGQRFSKIVQTMGFANKSEYFDSIGLAKSKSISNAIEEHFPDGEIAINGKHVIRNRRD